MPPARAPPSARARTVSASGATRTRSAASSQLPLLHLGGTARGERAVGGRRGRRPAPTAWEQGRALGLECVVRVSDSDDLERALRGARPGDLPARRRSRTRTTTRSRSLLALLHDVPAGKLAIADLHDATADDVAELERAGVDGVLVVGGQRRGARRRRAAGRLERQLGADRSPHGWRRLPRSERRHPCGRPPLDRPRPRDGRVSATVGKGSPTGIFVPLGRREVSGILPRGGTILGTTRTNPYKVEGGVEACCATSPTSVSTPSSRSAARTRSASPPVCTVSTTSPSSAFRRRSTTTSPGPTTRSASIPPSPSRPRRSTGCTRPPSRTTA